MNAIRRAARPLSGYEVASTSNVDEAAAAISSTYCGHEIRFLDRAADLNFRLCEARLLRTSVGSLSFDADIHYDLGETESCFLIQLAESGSINYLNGGVACGVTRDAGMVTSPTRPLIIQYHENSCGLIVKIGRDALEAHLRALTGASIIKPLTFVPQLSAESPFIGRYKRLLRYLVSELEAGDALGEHPVLITNIEDAVMTALLTGQPHNYSQFFQTVPATAAEQQVCDVEEFMRAHASEPMTIDDLVAYSGISGRSLFRAFQRYRRTSPMSFLRTIRLDQARDRLRSPQPGTTVTAVAHDCGFEHLGRFSADYRKRFTESPSETLRKAMQSQN